MRVLDFGWVWSAPWVGTMLGELGAQVIKVEHALRPDNLRLSGRVMRAGKVVEGPSKEMSPMYHQINHGKLGITLNAKEPRAVELLKRLAAMSDVAVENMSPGSMERTHLGYDVLGKVNPRIVMLAMSVAGQFGELSSMRAYAPTMSSFAGMEALVGYRGEQPIGALNFAMGDPGASVHALVALLAALHRARATGQGCYLDFSQIEALLGALRPYLLDAQVQGRQPPTTGNAHPDMAPHGIYPAREADAWLTIAVATDAQWRALQRLAADQAWANDSRFATRTGRLAHAVELDTALKPWTAAQPRDSLIAALRGAGIAASPVLSIQQQWQDPHYGARHVKQRVTIPFYGDEDVFRAPWMFSDIEPRIERCGPSTGEHNDYVFGELLGLPADEIAALKASGVIA
jgi:crotonobetainyl-CoA:carnitine CoA-transferase CaiB-like acyl-CoA transferase